MILTWTKNITSDLGTVEFEQQCHGSLSLLFTAKTKLLIPASASSRWFIEKIINWKVKQEWYRMLNFWIIHCATVSCTRTQTNWNLYYDFLFRVFNKQLMSHFHWTMVDWRLFQLRGVPRHITTAHSASLLVIAHVPVVFSSIEIEELFCPPIASNVGFAALWGNALAFGLLWS